MIDYGLYALKLAFAGLGSIFLHYGIIGLIIAGLLALELLSPIIGAYIPPLEPLLSRFRKDILWLAAILAFGMVMMYVGTRDEKARCEAKAVVVKIEVHKQVTKAKQSPRLDRWDTDK